MDINVQGEIGSQNAFTQEAMQMSLFDGFFKNSDKVFEFPPDIDVTGFYPQGKTGYDKPLDEQMRQMMHEVTVFEGARLAFVSIAHQIPRFVRFAIEKTPLQPCRESCSSPAPQTRFVHLCHHLGRCQLPQSFFHGGISTVAAVHVKTPDTRNLNVG